MSDAKREWLFNGFLTLVLAAVVLGTQNWRAHAEANAEAGLLINAMDNENERLVLVDLKHQNIMVYRNRGVGEFRLMSARTYKFDLEHRDTSKYNEIEGGKGADVKMSVDRYRLENARKPK